LSPTGSVESAGYSKKKYFADKQVLCQKNALSRNRSSPRSGALNAFR
jgi:hypothetical protein